MTSQTTIESLEKQFSIPGAVSVETGGGGLPRIVVSTPFATAHVYPHGAHVTHFQPAGQLPLLFMSGKSQFAADKPIRGGVPICFPWFGPKADNAAAPAHGFARTKPWTVESTIKTGDGSVRVAMSLTSDESTRKWWPFDFLARYTVAVGRELRLEFEVNNTGSLPMKFEEALHTYLSVSDVRQVSVDGLQGATYFDKAAGKMEVESGNSPIKITGETDRVYLATRATCVAHDPAGKRSIAIAKGGSDATVVWNPWIAKAKAMEDFGDDEWPGMLCIETCNVRDHAVSLNPGHSHTITAVIRGS